MIRTLLIIVSLVIFGLDNFSTANPIYFQPQTEYIFELESDVDLQTSGKIVADAKIGLIAVQNLSIDAQEVFLKIHFLHISTGNHKAHLDDQIELTKWFSFLITKTGEIKTVWYPVDEDQEVADMKKSIVGLLSGNYLPRDDQLIHPSKSYKDSWHYVTHESGPGGGHHANYSARTTRNGVIFQKKHVNHTIDRGKIDSSHEKEVHYNNHHGLPIKVQINEHVTIPFGSSYRPYSYDDADQTDDDNNRVSGVTELKATSKAHMTLHDKRKGSPPNRPNSNKLMSDVLLLKQDLKKEMTFNETEMWNFIKGNLTCLREQKVKKIFMGSCFKDLCNVVDELPETHVTKVVKHYFNSTLKSQKRSIRTRLDRQNIMLAVASLHTEYSLELLTKSILLAKKPEKKLVENLFVASVAMNNTISMTLINTLENMIFHPDTLPASLRDQDIQRMAVLVLGAQVRKLRVANRIKEAERIVERIENAFGIHDPWAYARHVAKLTFDERIEFDFDVAAHVEALGNAGIPRSFEHVHSYANSSSTSTILKRAGLNALRSFDGPKASATLFEAATQHKESHIRCEAERLYRKHPDGVVKNSSSEAYLTCMTPATIDQPQASEYQESEHRSSRKKRSVWEGWQFLLETPSPPINWYMNFGNKYFGASASLTLENKLEFDFGLLEGGITMLIHDAFSSDASIIGLFNPHLLYAGVCFGGSIGYKLNIMKELGELKQKLAKTFDDVLSRIVDNISKHITKFLDLLDDAGLPLFVENMIGALEEIPLLNLKNVDVADLALKQLQKLDTSKLPPVIGKAKDLVTRARELSKDIYTDLMEYFEKVSETARAFLPSMTEQMTRSSSLINEQLPGIYKTPHNAMDNIHKGVINTKVAADAILKVKDKLKLVSRFREGPEELAQLKSELKKMEAEVLNRLQEWIMDSSKKVSEKRTKIRDDVMNALDDISFSFDSVKAALKEYTDSIDKFDDYVKTTKTMYDELETGVLDSRSQIDQIFGTKVHKDFPREHRLAGSGCNSDGFYPTTADGYYEDQGVDLRIDINKQIVSPYSGSILLPNGGFNQVQLKPTGGTFSDVILFIDNIIPNENIAVGKEIEVVAGKPLGRVNTNGPCGSNYHIHVVMKSLTKPTEPKDDYGINVDRTSAPNLSVFSLFSNLSFAGTQDPSANFMERIVDIGTFQYACDEYRVEILSNTLWKGSITNGGQPKEIKEPADREPFPDLTNHKIKRSSNLQPADPPDWFTTLPPDTDINDNLNYPIQNYGSPLSTEFSSSSFKVGEVNLLYTDLHLADEKMKLDGLVQQLVDHLVQKQCGDAYALTNQELTTMVMERGFKPSTSRQSLIDQVLRPDDRCPLLHISLPIDTYCQIDATCLATECCVNIPFESVKFTAKTFIRYDPCLKELTIGINSWTLRVSDESSEWDLDQEEKIGFGVPYDDMMNISARYTIERTPSLLLLSLSIRFCHSDQAQPCSLYFDLFKESAFIVPICEMNETLTWNVLNMDDYFGRIYPQEFLKTFINETSEDSEDWIESSFVRVKRYWNSVLENGTEVYTAQENMRLKLFPEMIFEPDQENTDDKTRRQKSIILMNIYEGSEPTRKRRSMESKDSPGWRFKKSISGLNFEDIIENTFNLPVDPSDSWLWEGINLIGGGLTDYGMRTFTKLISDSSLRDLEVFLDAVPTTKSEIAAVIRDLIEINRFLIEDEIDTGAYFDDQDEFVTTDFVKKGQANLYNDRFPVFRWLMAIPLGFVIVKFDTGLEVYYGLSFPYELNYGTMITKVALQPYVGMRGHASLSIGFIFYMGYEFVSDIMDTHLPLSQEREYSKVPVIVTNRLDMQTTALKLRLYMHIYMKALFVKVTLYKKTLWSWSTPTSNVNLWTKKKEKKDNRPPKLVEFLVDKVISKRSVEDGYPPEPTQECIVKQVRGLDYTEATYELILAAYHEKSRVLYTYSVGLQPGGRDVVNNKEFAGPYAIITNKDLATGHPLYFTVKAASTEGLSATATCVLSSFDVTPPEGRVDVGYHATSRPDFLRASAILLDDSEMLITREALGFGESYWGDQIIPWNDIDMTNITSSLSYMNKGDELSQFSIPREGKVVATPAPPISVYWYIDHVECARNCLSFESCQSFNFEFSWTGYCELLPLIESRDHPLHKSGVFKNYERLGAGYAIPLEYSGLNLLHNNLYYFNIYIMDYLGYENTISSHGILTDFTPPDPALIRNASLDKTEWEPCESFVPDDWQDLCVAETFLPNHRVIIDGPGSFTVFNGYEELQDMLYTKANNFLSANWEEFEDIETGIYGYTWAVGTDICDDDVSYHVDPHAHLFHEGEWTHEGLVADLDLPDGRYYVTVRALNKVDFGGPMVLSVCHSTPFTIDNTDPIIYQIWNLHYDEYNGLISVDVNATDPESGLLELHMALGRSPRDNYLMDWIIVPLMQNVQIDFTIPDGVPAWVKLKAVNNVLLEVSGHADTSLLVDTSPPIPGQILDGNKISLDLKFTNSPNEICANWQNVIDPESGISSFLWGVGIQPGRSDVVDFMRYDSDAQIACANAQLLHNQQYFSTLIAFNGGYNKLNTTITSNGVIVDLTPPVEGRVCDERCFNETDLTFSSDQATVAATWHGFYDPESGVSDYTISVYRKLLSSDLNSKEFEMIQEPLPLGSDTFNFQSHHFHLHHDDFVYVHLRTSNEAASFTDSTSDGFLVDLTPPVLKHLGDGANLNEDIAYQTSVEDISFNWNYVDDESGIDLFQFAIYEMKQGRKQKIYPEDPDDNVFQVISDSTLNTYTQTDLYLRPGYLYITVMKAINGAKLISSHETTGTRIDFSPPEMRYIQVGVVDGEGEEVIDGYVYQSDRHGIQASWLATDPQSSIKAYWVSVGSQKHSEDIRQFHSFENQPNGYISDLNLELTDEKTCNDTGYNERCRPVYFVCVKAQNGAGDFSKTVCSTPIKVVEADKIGYISDGPVRTLNQKLGMAKDEDAQSESTTVTVTFQGFQSDLHGIVGFEWAIGTSPGAEDVQPFMSDGILVDDDNEDPNEEGCGIAQAPHHLQQGIKYFSTVRAFTGAGNILVASSDGFVLDRTEPDNVLSYFQSDSPRVANMETYYQDESESASALWETSDTESSITMCEYGVGTFPSGLDVYPLTLSNKTYLAPGEIPHLQENGKPNFLSITATNSVGLRSTSVFKNNVVVDSTPPSIGQVICPRVMHTRDVLKCTWTDFHDKESPIYKYEYSIGSSERLDDVLEAQEVSPLTTSFQIPVEKLSLQHNSAYYVNIKATNEALKDATSSSSSFLIDDTPPTPGVVVELAGEHVRLNDTECITADDCMKLDAVCLKSISSIAVAWQPFDEKDSKMTKYEVALGTTPSGTQIKDFTEVIFTPRVAIISNLDLSSVEMVYASVRGFNEAGLSSVASSNGIYISRRSLGLLPLAPLEVNDGSGGTDRDFQSSNEEMSATWDFSGDPCPIIKYEWAIHRIDGVEVQDFTEIADRTEAFLDELSMTDGETYYVTVRGTDSLGQVETVRSDGITIQRDPLIPGTVFDGPFLGSDLNFQQDIHTLYGNWDGFGAGKENTDIDHTGNEEVDVDPMKAQTVDFYEVAVGTDRRYPTSRDNVVPFTNVGKNQTVVFGNLDLLPSNATYYLTVRAHSANFATAEVTSNGIICGITSSVTAGELTVPDYINSITEVEVQWAGFQSPFSIKEYYVGIGNASVIEQPSVDCDNFILGDDTCSAIFNVYDMVSVGLDTYALISDLSLIHGGLYFITVAGRDATGECNSTTSTFTVDITNPSEGKIRIGPLYDMLLAYTQSSYEIPVWWKDFTDEESGIDRYKIQLLSASACKDEINGLDVMVDWLELPATSSHHIFNALELMGEQPYFVEMIAFNTAGGNTSVRSSPVLLDTSHPTGGVVVDGVDFKNDKVFHSDTSTISGSLLHLPTSTGSSCPQLNMPFTATDWDELNVEGLWNMNIDDWKIEYTYKQISVSDETLAITLERETSREYMISGTYAVNAHILNGGKYEVYILAANTDVNAVTSVVFWDGPQGYVGDFPETQSDMMQIIDEECLCCFDEPILEDCRCNCTEFLGRDIIFNGTMTNLTTTPQPTTPPSPTVPWVIVEEHMQKIVQRSCGLQLLPDNEISYAKIWCRYFDDEWDPEQMEIELYYDPSKEWHLYTITFDSTPTEDSTSESHWNMELLIDGEPAARLEGVPQLSTNTQLLLHVWNRENKIAKIEDPFYPPTSSAQFRDLSLPPDQDVLCRYGEPFRAGTSPVVQYLAGVGTDNGLVDLVSFREVARPCFPCLSPCDFYHCSTTCPKNEATAFTFTLDNLSLPVDNMKDNMTTPIFVTVKSVLANGNSLSVSSSGIIMDTSPPVLDFMYYIDVELDEYEPVAFQSSTTTIQVYWAFIDYESDIKEYSWAIGRSKGVSDIQDFVNVGLNQSPSNNGLDGILEDKKSYYVTIKAVNHAGAETIMECYGVTVQLESPSAAGVNASVISLEDFENNAYPSTYVKKTENAHFVGMSWTKAEDETVTSYEYCVGSSYDNLDDVVECIPVGRNASGTVTINGGIVTAITDTGDRASQNISSLRVPNDTETVSQSDNFYMEPGKHLYSRTRVCNSASLCTLLDAGTSIIIGEHDKIITSNDGEDIEISLPHSKSRRRRSANDSYEYTMTIKTSGGLQKGGSLVFGALEYDRIDEHYDSDGVSDYKPYIVSLEKTMDKLSRILRRRVKRIYYPAFFLSSVGQEELQGPLHINLSFPDVLDMWKMEMPRLIFWNPDLQEWDDGSETCGIEKPPQYNPSSGTVFIEVCATTDLGKPHQKTYFNKETQFAIALVTVEIPNDPPEFTNVISPMFITEDEGYLMYKYEAMDPDDDILEFLIDEDSDSSIKYGTVILESDGLLTYTPCLDCSGSDIIRIMVKEKQTIPDVEELSSKATIEIDVSQQNDIPTMYISINGWLVGDGTDALITTEQLTEKSELFQDIVFEVGAYDTDASDILTLETTATDFGNLTKLNEFSGIPKHNPFCGYGNESSNMNETLLPCDFNLPHAPEEFSWTVNKYAYQPARDFYGFDSLRCLTSDETGALSELLVVNIAVMVNPCVNGTCKGQNDSDLSCNDVRRTESFEGFMCECIPGAYGNFCQYYDECLIGICPTPHDKDRQRAIIIGTVTSVCFLLILVALVLVYMKKTKRLPGKHKIADVSESNNDLDQDAEETPIHLFDIVKDDPACISDDTDDVDTVECETSLYIRTDENLPTIDRPPSAISPCLIDDADKNQVPGDAGENEKDKSTHRPSKRNQVGIVNQEDTVSQDLGYQSLEFSSRGSGILTEKAHRHCWINEGDPDPELLETLSPLQVERFTTLSPDSMMGPPEDERCSTPSPVQMMGPPEDERLTTPSPDETMCPPDDDDTCVDDMVDNHLNLCEVVPDPHQDPFAVSSEC